MRFTGDAETQRQAQRTHFEGGAGSFCGLGRVGIGVWLRGDSEGFAVGAEALGLSGDVAGGTRVRWVRFGRVNGFVCFGLGVQDGFVW